LLSERISRKEYIVVFFVLGILTGIEIWAADATSGNLKIWTLIILALVKAACVAMFFMHLKTERNWLRLIAVLPLLTGAFAYVLILEVMFR
jgi:caa(3)-type oxidase subunit IV